MVDMFRVSGFMYMSDPPHGMLILDLNAGGSPLPPGPSLTAPILTKTSSAGQQLAFTVTFDASYAGKYFHLQLAGASNFTTPLSGEGAIREVTQLITTDDVNNGPTFTILASQPPGAIYARLYIIDDSPATSAASNVINDTVVIPVARWIYNAAPTPFHAEFSSPDPVDFTGQSFGAGTAIVWLSTRDNPPASVTYNGAAMTLERSLTDGNHSLRLYKKTGVSADANVTITVTPSGPSKRDYGIATGTLASSINHASVDFKTLAVGFGADPQTTPTFTLPANGVALACVGNIGNGVTTTWGSGTANTERHGANGDFAFGTASMLGGASDATGQTFAANGFDHAGAGIIAVIFGP